MRGSDLYQSIRDTDSRPIRHQRSAFLYTFGYVTVAKATNDSVMSAYVFTDVGERKR